MAPGAIGGRIKGEKSQNRSKKPLPSWWNEAMAPKAAGRGLVS